MASKCSQTGKRFVGVSVKKRIKETIRIECNSSHGMLLKNTATRVGDNGDVTL